MTENRNVRDQYRHGGIFPLLAVILLVLTLVLFFIELSPEKALSRALEKTLSRREKEEKVLTLLGDVLRDGEILMEGEEIEGYYRANEGKKAELSLSGEKEFSLFAGEALSLSSEKLEASGQREGAAAGVIASEDALDWEERLLTYVFAAVTDPGLQKDKGAKTLRFLWDRADPDFFRKKSEIQVGDRISSATEYCYTFSSEDLERLMDAVTEADGEEEAFLRAVFAPFFSSKEEAESFLEGEGERFESLRDTLSQGKAQITFTVRKGYAVKSTLSWEGQDSAVFASVELGETPEKIGGETLRLVFTRGEEEKEITVKQTVEEDRTAYLRTVTWKTLTGGEEETGGIRFSYGKNKQDLGLRVTTRQGEFSFRGILKEYRRGKEAVILVNRMEWNQERLFEKELTLTVKKSGAAPGKEPSYDAPLPWQKAE